MRSSRCLALITCGTDGSHLVSRSGLYRHVESHESQLLIMSDCPSRRHGTIPKRKGGAGSEQKVIHRNRATRPIPRLGQGQCCLVYTNEVHPEAGGLPFGNDQAMWRNSRSCGYLHDAAGNLGSEWCYDRNHKGATMPTTPQRSVLDRDMARASAKPLIALACPLLREIVNNGTWVVLRCQTEKCLKTDRGRAACIILYYHMLEQADGIEVLLHESCPGAAVGSLRSCFEARLYLEHILKEDEERERRGLAWIYSYYLDKLAYVDLADETTDRGRAFQSDDLVKSRRISPPSVESVQESRDTIQTILDDDRFAEVRAAFVRAPKQAKWFSLFGGERTIRALAKSLGHGAWYEVLYRGWCSVTHANDLSRFVTRKDNGDHAYLALRAPVHLKDVAIWSCTMLLDATEMMLGRYRPGEDYSRWRDDEVDEPLARLISYDVNVRTFRGQA